ncbi:hypothetical protein I204_01982 [Kwoniella mangroviensis CBS 8886]|uniref:uncharacterized protein n=1 Tax=Kwoniella mangroviensis CBS 8507 TaxID=1296122 RepID=UPI00080CCAB3|nr:uncharacterized protein I203_03712 [Kwoniella mangroviensis CBS 8507]OCF67029.1 hypothetical protein I203_03712 [Kwoniella mangroviensis CBS 8507]OCF77977.1 hypothetical protein I204_01982 [Kwoniella mangroviensis CBS 8886]
MSQASSSFSQTDRSRLTTSAQSMLQGHQGDWVTNAVEQVESYMQSNLMDMSDTAAALTRLRTVCDEIKSNPASTPKGKRAIG